MKSVKVSKDNKEWYLGLDIGTNSVGFCATNLQYDILTKGNHLQCGARLFEDASDASERRTKRSIRRRLARRKVRLQLLKELFAPAIDDSFFLSMDESNLLIDDKTQKHKYSLFNDKDFSDADYFNKFPTIYHLRYFLQNNITDDIRLVYLACHHMMKYRGHFLFNQFNSSSSNESFSKIVEDINECLLKTSESDDCEQFYSADIDNVLNDSKKTERRADFWDRIANSLNPKNDKRLKQTFEIIKGKNIKIKELWPELYESLESSGKKEEIPNLSFKDPEFDGVFSGLISAGIFSDDQISLICACKQLYDTINLYLILDGAETISEAQVKKYNQHKEDLKVLKTFVRKYIPDEYNKMFRWNTKEKSGNDGTYVHYVQSSNVNNKKTIAHSSICTSPNAAGKTCNSATTANYEDFIDYLKKKIINPKQLSNEAVESDEYKYIESRVSEGIFCQKLRTSDNAYIPNQLVSSELEKILHNQQSCFPEVLTEDTIEKIIKLISFRIPYYVGPLSDKNDNFAWVKRTTPHSHTPITPWNFDEEVDKFASGEEFISRMLSRCTYLKDETVLPKQSLLYQKYMLLQDINNLKLNGSRIKPDLKDIIYNGICQNETSLTKKKIEDYLKGIKKLEKEDRLTKNDELDSAFNSSLSSYIICKKILGISAGDLSSQQYDMCEKIIKWHTVFSSEKDAVRQRIEKEYGSVLTIDQIEKFSRLNFSGWGRLSEKFLTEIKVTYRSREYSIMDILQEKCLNLMEILNATNFDNVKVHEEGEKSLFLEEVKKYNMQFDNDCSITYDDVDELYCSPIVKRSIWQTILVVKDLVNINRVFPKKVFVEVTRAEDIRKKNKLQSSRLEQIQKLYKEAKNVEKEYKEISSQLNERVTKDQMRSDRIFLYFMQLGKCMYTGRPLDFDKVVNGDGMYDIDHIYPQSMLIDDSLSNRVLVLRSENAKKTDIYPLSDEIRTKMRPFWDFLKSNKLLDSKKYDRLISSSQLSSEEIAGFNNRQLVSTNQAVKSVCVLLDRMFNLQGESKTEIVYSKAQHVSNFRQIYKILKCRDVNDIHHAHDAYLNIVVGNVWSVMFKELPGTNETRKFENLWTKRFAEFSKNIIEEGKNNGNKVDEISVTTKCLFNSKFLHGMGRDVVWQADYIKKIKSYTINCNESYVNKFVITKMPHEMTGAFYKETIHIKGDNVGSADGLIPLKKGLDPNKYGGYRKEETSFLCLIEYKNKSTIETVREFCKVPVRLANLREKDEKDFLEKICLLNGIKVSSDEVRIVYPKILIDHTLEIDGCRYYVRSGNLDCRTTCQWYPSPDIIKIVRAVAKNISRLQSAKKDNKKIKIDIENITFSDTEYLFNAIVEQLRKKFYSNYTFAKKIMVGDVTLERFKKLDLVRRIEILNEIMKNINHSSSVCKSNEIGGAKNGDNCRWNQANPKGRKVSLVTYSPSGLFEKVIPLIN